MKNLILIFSFFVYSTCMTQQSEILSKTYNYLLYIPGFEAPDNGYPFILFLHGSGERGDGLAKVKVHGPPSFLDDTTDFPFVVVSPQCLAGERWDPDKLLNLLDEIISISKIDTSRIIITGLSMGGRGTWDRAIAAPGKFAAIAPVCGTTDPAQAFVIKDIPCWVFHGAKDTIVPVYHSDNMVEALKLAGADVRYTRYPDEDHFSWVPAYNTPELYEWMLKQQKK